MLHSDPPLLMMPPRFSCACMKDTMIYLTQQRIWVCLMGFVLCFSCSVNSFAPRTKSLRKIGVEPGSLLTSFDSINPLIRPRYTQSSVKRYSSSNDEISISESDQAVVGVVGSFASLVVLYSEYTLKNTGCGLPAGPLGLVGLIEGLSYLTIVGIVGLSLFTKVKTGSGLPSGPAGLLGAAEGLSYLAALAGIVALALQITNFGYIPNAIPMEGGMCT